MSTTINTEEWLAALQEAGAGTTITAPPGWLTTREFERLLGLTHTVAKTRLRMLRDAGLAEAQMFNIIDCVGHRKPVVHYRLLKRQKK